MARCCGKFYFFFFAIKLEVGGGAKLLHCEGFSRVWKIEWPSRRVQITWKEGNREWIYLHYAGNGCAESSVEIRKILRLSRGIRCIFLVLDFFSDKRGIEMPIGKKKFSGGKIKKKRLEEIPKWLSLMCGVYCIIGNDAIDVKIEFFFLFELLSLNNTFDCFKFFLSGKH